MSGDGPNSMIYITLRGLWVVRRVRAAPGLHSSGLTGSVTLLECEAPPRRAYRRLDSVGQHPPKHESGFSLAAEATACTWLIDEVACGYLLHSGYL